MGISRASIRTPAAGTWCWISGRGFFSGYFDHSDVLSVLRVSSQVSPQMVRGVRVISPWYHQRLQRSLGSPVASGEWTYGVAVIVSLESGFGSAVEVGENIAKGQGRQLVFESAFPMGVCTPKWKRRCIPGTKWIHGQVAGCVAGLLCRNSTLRWAVDGIRHYHGDIVERHRLTQVVGSVSHQPG